MHSNVGQVLVDAVDAFTGLALDGLSVAELQRLTGALVPQLERLAGVKSRLVGELVVRSGGTVPAVALVADAPGVSVPGPSVLVRHWLRDLGRAGAPAAGRDVRQAKLLRQLPLVHAAVLDGRLPMAQAVLLTRLVGVIDAVALAEAEPALVLVALDRDPQERARRLAPDRDLVRAADRRRRADPAGQALPADLAGARRDAVGPGPADRRRQRGVPDGAGAARPAQRAGR